MPSRTWTHWSASNFRAAYLEGFYYEIGERQDGRDHASPLGEMHTDKVIESHHFAATHLVCSRPVSSDIATQRFASDWSRLDLPTYIEVGLLSGSRSGGNDP